MDKDIIRLHKEGLSNRQIAISLNAKYHGLINQAVKRLGLKPNGSVRQNKLIMKNGKGLCTKCKTWQDVNRFKIMRQGKNYEYRLTYCKDCQTKQYINYLNNNQGAYWQRRHTAWKKKALQRGVEFKISKDYIISAWDIQKHLCGYTNLPMNTRLGTGLSDNSVSLDRFDNTKGYIAGNVLLCLNKFNTIKNNISLKEMKEWMPGLYKNGIITLTKLIPTNRA